MSNVLPSRPSLDHLRKQAKELLAGARRGDPAALERMALPAGADPARLALHDAQTAIAREYGFASWPRLKAHVVSQTGSLAEKADEFIRAAVSGNRTLAQELLGAHPEIARTSVFAGLAAVDESIALDEESAAKPGGPNGWHPIHYLTFSRFVSERPQVATRIARRLLALGADPNAGYTNPDWPDLPQTPLYGATGVNNCPELARALLEAGADPTDCEAIYHSAELPDHDCLRLLLEFGADTHNTNGLARKLDFDDLAGVRMMLEFGVDPNEGANQDGNALHHAIQRGRSVAFLELLVDYGADVNALNKQKKTPYAWAVRIGDTAGAAFLASRGADTSLTPADQLLGACASANRALVEELLRANPNAVSTLSARDRAVIVDLAARGRTEGVRTMLEAGVSVMAGSESGPSALHQASWSGHVDTVRLLLEHGARVDALDPTYHGTPLGWAGYASTDGAPTSRDHAEVATLLIEAGSPLPKRAFGSKAFAEVLRQHGVPD